jgi:hypothetical protein
VFLVTPLIRDAKMLLKSLKTLMPEIRFLIAHGGHKITKKVKPNEETDDMGDFDANPLNELELEDRILAFERGEVASSSNL